MRTHLDYLKESLSREQARLVEATKPAEKELRAAWASQLQNEISHEIEFLKSTGQWQPETEMSDDELLAELLA